MVLIIPVYELLIRIESQCYLEYNDQRNNVCMDLEQYHIKPNWLHSSPSTSLQPTPGETEPPS